MKYQMGVARLLLALLVMCFVAQVAWAGSEGADKERLKRRIKAGLKADEAGEIVFCNPTQIFEDYSANEVAADSKYKGKWVEMKGQLLAVSKDFTGDPYLVFSADSYGMARVNAELFPVQIGEINSEQKDIDACTDLQAAARLKKGQNVLVNCKGLGAVMGVPRLGQCVIVPQ